MPHRGVLVVRYIEGRTLAEADLRTLLELIVPMLSTCRRDVGKHLAGPALSFRVFHVIRYYARTLRADRAKSERDLASYVALADALEAQQAPLPIVFGHHDLLPGNLIDDGTRLWLIDREYGGLGTAMFDLANLATSGRYSEDDDCRLLETYFQQPVSDDVQRSFDAMKVASALREALWGLVSSIRLSAPGADYATHAAEYFARTDAALDRHVQRHGVLRAPA